MKTLQDLKNAKNTKGLIKTVKITDELKELIFSLELTKENEQYASVLINDDSLVKYEQSTDEKKEGLRVINYSKTLRRNTYRIYRIA